MTDAIATLEEAELFSDDHNESPPSDIVAYNELRSCADIIRMHRSGALDISPDFQRDFVWSSVDQTRFIDSLIKQLPIPSMCLAYDYKKNLWIVIDGLQRINTIVRFLGGADWKLANLDDIDPGLSGKNAATIKNAADNKIAKGGLSVFYSRVENQALPINVLRCDFSKRSHMEYLFTIFHRLNSGGMKLNNQEIRNCIFSGSFNDELRRLDRLPSWRKIALMKEDSNYRFAKQEQILRFFAFRERQDEYKGSVSKFLNDYMFRLRNADENDLKPRSALFERVTTLVAEKIYPDKDVDRLPGTVLEALLIGIADNIDALEGAEADDLQARWNEFRGHESVSDKSLSEGLSKKDKVDARLAAAREIFAR